jgi:choline kinase
MNVVIYAAGVAKRLQPVLGGVHKGLCFFGEKRLIEYQLDWIVESCVENIVIVLGLEHEEFKEKIGETYKGKKINYVYNDDYKDKGNMLSLWAAKEFCSSDVLFTTSDLVVDPFNVKKFLVDSAKSKILIDCDKSLYSDPDPVKVKIKKDRITRLHKELSYEDVSGLAIGIYHFSKVDISKIINKIEENISAGEDNLSLYRPIDSILTSLETKPVFCENSNWFDIDTPEDLNRARKLIDSDGKLNFGAISK